MNAQLDSNGRLKHFLSTENLPRSLLEEILDNAERFAPLVVHEDKCVSCRMCLKIGCPAIEWREGEGFVIKLHDGDSPMAPFQRAEFNYQLSPAGPDATLIALSLTFEMPWGGFGETLGEWFILPMMEKNLVQVAAGMKHFYETGTPATDEDRERLAGAVEIAPAGD